MKDQELIKYEVEKSAFGVCTYLSEKLGIASGRVRTYFIYLTFATLGSSVLVYLFLAFWINIRKYLKRSNPNTTFGIPNFIWYLIMIGMVGYLIKEVFLLNNMKDVPSVVSTITKEVNEIKNTTNKALENAKAVFLGRQGEITTLMKGLGKLPPEQRRAEGAAR